LIFSLLSTQIYRAQKYDLYKQCTHTRGLLGKFFFKVFCYLGFKLLNQRDSSQVGMAS